MTDTSLILGLPYIQPSQAQKHVTHNEALRVLDALVQLSVVATDASLPPSGAASGDRYVVAGSGQGLWAGHGGEIAVFDGITWTFLAPQTGWQAYVTGTGQSVVFDGTAWRVQGLETVDQLGVNATADALNRLSVSSDAVLLNHAGSDHQLKVNKATETDTASLLFQTGFSGRAEMGIAGNDDFSIKVSDGGAWFEALRIEAATGKVNLPQSQWREVLAAPRTYYVDPTLGSDANNGLSSAGAFASVARAVLAAQLVDAGGHEIIIQLADGIHSIAAPLTFDREGVGYNRLILQGNSAAPELVVLDGTGTVLDISCGTVLLRGLRVQTTSATDDAVLVRNRSSLELDRVDFGTATAGHMRATTAQVRILGDYDISGSAAHHLYLEAGAVAEAQPSTVTLTGAPDFSESFVLSWECSVGRFEGLTFVGAATGERYSVTRNAMIETQGGGETYFPGDVDGSTSRGGRYF